MSAGTTSVSLPESGGMAEWLGGKIKSASDAAKQKREEMQREGKELPRSGSLFSKGLGYEFSGKYIDRFSSIGVKNPLGLNDYKARQKEQKETEKGFAGIVSVTNKLVDTFKKNSDEMKKVSADIEIQNSILLKLVTINKQILDVNKQQFEIQKEQLEKAELAAAEKELEKKQDAAGTLGIKSPYDQEEDGEDKTGFLGDLFGNFRKLLDIVKLFSSLGRRGFVRFFKRSGLKLFGKKGLQNLSKFLKTGKGQALNILKKGAPLARLIGKASLPLLAAETILDTSGQEAAAERQQQKTGVRPGEIYRAEDAPGGIAKSGATPQLASGGIVGGSRNNILPLHSNTAQKLLGEETTGAKAVGYGGMRGGEAMGFAQPLADAMQLPFKIAGGAIFGLASTFLNSLGPIGGIFKPLLVGPITSLLEVMGFPSTMLKGLYADGKDPLAYFRDIVKSTKESISTTSASLSSKKTTTSTTSPAPTTTEPTSPSPDVPSTTDPAKRLTADEFAAKQIRDTKLREEQGPRNSTRLVPEGNNLSQVRNAENQSATQYYHDMLGNMYKIDEKNKKLIRATQDEISRGIPSPQNAFGAVNLDFYKKPDGNVVAATLQSAPVASIQLKSRKIVDTKTSGRSRVKYLRDINAEDQKNLNINQVYSPFGAKQLQEGGQSYKLGLDQTRSGMHIKTGETTGDTVQADLEKGEYIVNRDAVAALGVPFFDRINFDLYPRKISGNKPEAIGGYQKGSFIIGDSIASGIAGRRGANRQKVTDTKGSSMVGAQPSEVLGFLKEISKSKMSGANVVLSTGATNAYSSGGDFANVKRQFDYLKSVNAKVSVAGTATSPNTKPYQPALKNINAKLAAEVPKYGFSFMGGFASTDGLHPNYSTYGKGISPSASSSPTAAAPASSETTTAQTPEERTAAAETEFRNLATAAEGALAPVKQMLGLLNKEDTQTTETATSAKPAKPAAPQSGSAKPPVDKKKEQAQQIAQTQIIIARQPVTTTAPSQGQQFVDYSRIIPYVII